MNTKLIEGCKVSELPYLPKLTGLKTNRVVTKHYTNCALYMSADKFSLLTWLIYQSRNDNSVRYNTHLLNKYSAAIKAAANEYGSEVKLKTSIQFIRYDFKWLIEHGYLFPNYESDIFTINPMLTYRTEYIRAAEYDMLVEWYNFVWNKTNLNIEPTYSLKELSKKLRDIINKRIKDKVK
jgi:hypothetical protein